MEKQGKKRPAADGDDKLGKNAKRRPKEEEMEEFYALIRRIRATSKLVDKEKSNRSQIFQWEDFVASSLNARAGNAAADGAAADGSAGGGGGGKELSSGRSSEEDERKDGDGEEESEAKGEGVEDNGLVGWLDLNVDLAAAKSSC